VRIAADVPLAITGGLDGTVRLWDIDSGGCRTELTAGKLPVRAVDITADGRFAASVSGDAIRLWDLAGPGRTVRSLRFEPRGYSSPLCGPLLDYSTVRISSDLKFVMWADDGRAEFWDLDNDRHTVLHDAGTGKGAAIDMAADGSLAAFAVAGLLRLWEPATGRCWECDPAPGGLAPGVVQLSRDGRYAVASGYASGRIQVWDLKMKGSARALDGHRGGAWALSISPEAEYLLSAGSDRTVRFWDLRDARCLRTFSGFDDAGLVGDSRLASAGRQAITISHDGAVRRWTLPARPGGTRLAQPWLSPPLPCADVADLGAQAGALLGEAEQALADGRYPRALEVLTRARAIEGHERDLRVLAAWRTLARSSVRTGLRASWPGTVLASGRLQSADLSGDGRIAAVCHNDGTVHILDVELGTTLGTLSLSPHGNGEMLVGLSADGTRLLIGEDDRVRVWSLETGEHVCTLPSGQGSLRSVGFAADADHVLVSGFDGRTQHWDLRDGGLLSTCDIRVDSAAWAGPVQLGAMADGLVHAVKVTELATGRIVLRLDAPGPEPEPPEPGQEGLFFTILREFKRPRTEWTAVALSADGSRLLTGNAESVIQLWDVATGEQSATFEKVPGHIPSVIRFTADGRFAVTAGRDFRIRAWDVSTGQCIRVIGGHRRPIDAVVIASDSRRMLSSSMLDGARLWELDWDLATPGPADRNHAAPLRKELSSL
jgi:WD40 repeat protein